MIDISFSIRFLRTVKKLPPALINEIYEKIEEFKDTNNHKKLKVHKLHGKLSGCFAFYVNYKIRIIFEYGDLKNDVDILGVGSHDEVY